MVPDLSLVPMKDYKDSRNAIDNFKTPKYNCFNFLDDDKIDGFDTF